MTFADALTQGRAALAGGDIANAAFDARLLLASAAGLDMAALIAASDDSMPALAQATYISHVKRRLTGEPVARIVGEAAFFGLKLKLNAATLVPRPDTEILVEAMLEEARRRLAPEITICDLGTGTGAIVIALLSELPMARAVATDISAEALIAARQNAEAHGVADRVAFVRADFAEGPERPGGPFDVVVSNPPYVRSSVIETLPREVSVYDPRLALDGGDDGLDAYRAILSRLDTRLAEGGIVGFETGYDQGDSVVALCRRAGLSEVGLRRDLAGRARVVTAVKTLAGKNAEGAKKALGKVG